MKKLIVLAILLLFAGQTWAETSWWLTPDGAIVGYDDLIPETYPNPEAKWIKIETMPFPPDPFKAISDCPWRIKVAPESEAEKWMNDGWKPFGVKPNWKSVGNGSYIYLKKRVCK